MEECWYRNDWLKWKYVIQAEIDSLAKHKVCGPIVMTPKDIKPVGYKWVFVRNEMRKMRLWNTKQD